MNATPLLLRPPVRASLALAGTFAALFAYAWYTPSTPASPGVLDPARIKAAEEKRVRDDLRDPDSARFRNAFVVRGRTAYVVCGEVNHKNDFGAYIGYRRYISGPQVMALESDVGSGEMAVLWASHCKRTP